MPKRCPKINLCKNKVRFQIWTLFTINKCFWGFIYTAREPKRRHLEFMCSSQVTCCLVDHFNYFGYLLPCCTTFSHVQPKQLIVLYEYYRQGNKLWRQLYRQSDTRSSKQYHIMAWKMLNLYLGHALSHHGSIVLEIETCYFYVKRKYWKKINMVWFLRSNLSSSSIWLHFTRGYLFYSKACDKAYTTNSNGPSGSDDEGRSESQ